MEKWRLIGKGDGSAIILSLVLILMLATLVFLSGGSA
jgi:hypothetical protein